MSLFNIITESENATVVSEYKPQASKQASYQSEAELEKDFIRMLGEQSYEYLTIHQEKDLIDNLRRQLELVNDYQFSDDEWNRFFSQILANPNNGIKEKTRIIQEDYRQILKKDDGGTKNISLIDKSNIHNNRLQVINQYEVKDGKHDNRYDVTILVNGLPLVHVELKRRGVAIKEAFNQINRYQRDSFWAGCGLFQYVQIFVISNGTHTKYYSNTTRANHIKDANSSSKGKKTKTSNSFEFTSFWADANNRVILDLVDFTKTFFSKHTLLNILTKYCVFTAEELLLVMRPYQIVATERILNRIEVSSNYKKYGTIDGGGYIWHTTGSGKTLTSFKTARLASKMEGVDKVLFVVDRKDLDYQTMREYDRFEKGAANSNRSTTILAKQLGDDKSNIIITTIQKLSTYIAKNKTSEAYDKHVVIIFDECHRSQFGEMHLAITRAFKKYHIFGFTGTPIFAVNSGSGKGTLKTTAQAFGDKLHAYTIVDAINDKNVLPFRVDYIKTVDLPEDIKDEKVWGIDREKVFMDPERIRKVTTYILDNFDRKTYRNQKKYKYSIVTNVPEVVMAKDRNKVKEEKRAVHVDGFNSIFAVASIDAAKLYYNEFKRQMKESPEKALRIGLIYSYGANEEEADGILDEENSESTDNLDATSRDFLESAIADYNEMFSTNYDTSSDKFQNYYKDVSLRMKNKELDLLIVVNMFLTGFDATTLNTLWVDKNLRMHGLLQAYSRTNRILNSIKTFGNIVCFRNLQKATDDAISLFGDKEATGLAILRGFKDYYYGFDDDKGRHHLGYVEMIDQLLKKFPIEDSIVGEAKQKEFIKLFGAVLRMMNLLSSFDDFADKEILSEMKLQNYKSIYLDLKDTLVRPVDGVAKEINDDIVFEIELLKQVDINIDYILMMVQQYHEKHCKDKEIMVKISKAIEASPELRSKKDLIISFVNGMNDVDADVVDSWRDYIREKKETELQQIITEEKLKGEETKKFVDDCFETGTVKTTGTDINNILPPTSRFGGGNRDSIRVRVLEKIKAYFERFFGME